MPLPINIDQLVNGNTIEWERVEFKQGWNPEVVIRSMCAFANDFHNWGGGYIIVGIAEDNGQPILPPIGLPQNQLDSIQKKIVELGHKISPNYFPIAQPYLLQEQHILVIWCPAGDNRPYDAPDLLARGAQRFPYIRITSNSVKAQGQNLRRLQELAARIPFDDRVNNLANINHLDLGLIREYLQEIKSDLLEESAQMPFADLCRTMLIAKGPNEDIRPVNVGLLFFAKKPEQFFDRAWIELVWHKDHSGKNFKEIYFKGPLHKQLRETLAYLQNNLIAEQVIKHANKAEAERFFNYPFEAIEEALSNAVYHKSYEYAAPIEIQIFPDRITILSHPAPLPPVNGAILATQKRIIAREYRNRRIGDFLKELHLTEGRGTGLPAIYSAMENNKSPEPMVESDDASYVLVTLAARHTDQATDQVNALIFNNLSDIAAYCDGAIDQATDQAADQAKAILDAQLQGKAEALLAKTKNWISRAQLFAAIGLSNHSTNRKTYLDPLISLGFIEMEYPQTPTHPKQQYRITHTGQRLKQLIESV